MHAYTNAQLATLARIERMQYEAYSNILQQRANRDRVASMSIVQEGEARCRETLLGWKDMRRSEVKQFKEELSTVLSAAEAHRQLEIWLRVEAVNKRRDRENQSMAYVKSTMAMDEAKKLHRTIEDNDVYNEVRDLLREQEETILADRRGDMKKTKELTRFNKSTREFYRGQGNLLASLSKR